MKRREIIKLLQELFRGLLWNPDNGSFLKGYRLIGQGDFGGLQV
jgi:hypothetical protein